MIKRVGSNNHQFDQKTINSQNVDFKSCLKDYFNYIKNNNKPLPVGFKTSFKNSVFYFWAIRV